MIPFLAVDPGAKAGWATFDERGRLARCGLALAKPPKCRIAWDTLPVCMHSKAGPAPWRQLVIEIPHMGRGKATPKALRTLAMRVGEIKGIVRAKSVAEIEPRRWKGTVPKEIFSRVIYREQMTDDEREFYDDVCRVDAIAPSYRHNVLDAIGLGIWWARAHGRARAK